MELIKITDINNKMRFINLDQIVTCELSKDNVILITSAGEFRFKTDIKDQEMLNFIIKESIKRYSEIQFTTKWYAELYYNEKVEDLEFKARCAENSSYKYYIVKIDDIERKHNELMNELKSNFNYEPERKLEIYKFSRLNLFLIQNDTLIIITVFMFLSFGICYLCS